MEGVNIFAQERDLGDRRSRNKYLSIYKFFVSIVFPSMQITKNLSFNARRIEKRFYNIKITGNYPLMSMTDGSISYCLDLYNWIYLQFFFIYLNGTHVRTRGARLNESEDNSVSIEEIRFKEKDDKEYLNHTTRNYHNFSPSYVLS